MQNKVKACCRSEIKHNCKVTLIIPAIISSMRLDFSELMNQCYVKVSWCLGDGKQRLRSVTIFILLPRYGLERPGNIECLEWN